ncbi:hypothetical protein LSTR_LSTR000293 [Laodelphax striatellus]|uniref:Uncharacterized protein n=1 Tax=Laodelphax striatellus TaxID=195883 RepID=A0A482X6R8_LAOST|nr:hypothetical protein LSTR_LSTR000293 [Laodelphax striatellus]
MEAIPNGKNLNITTSSARAQDPGCRGYISHGRCGYQRGVEEEWRLSENTKEPNTFATLAKIKGEAVRWNIQRRCPFQTTTTADIEGYHPVYNDKRHWYRDLLFLFYFNQIFQALLAVDIAEMPPFLSQLQRKVPKLVSGTVNPKSPGSTSLFIANKMESLKIPHRAPDQTLENYYKVCLPTGNIHDYWAYKKLAGNA